MRVSRRTVLIVSALYLWGAIYTAAGLCDRECGSDLSRLRVSLAYGAIWPWTWWAFSRLQRKG
jgi:hypothetical protein